jgi:alpha-glucoside transport system substrate-binding protein
MRPPRTIALLLFAFLISFGGIVAACGDDDDDGDGAATPADGTPADGAGDIGTVNVIGLWGDAELESFEAMVDPWIDETGGSMDFVGTRDITPILTTRVEGGDPPDVALPAEVGLFQQFASEGLLTPLSECAGLEDLVRNNYPESFIELGTVDGELYGFFMKADTKGTIFYNPAFFEENNLTPLEAAATFDDLIALSDEILALGTPPWSNGQNANGGTGFPGSDSIQQILLNDAGADVYDGVVEGTTPYTDPAVSAAWENFGRMVLTEGYTSQGGAQGVLATQFMASAYPPFEDPPAAGMVALGGFAAGFITDQFPDAVPGTDFDFFPWPGGAVTGGSNIAYAFNSDPTTCSFLMHIASAEAQQIWVERGGFTSVNEGVSLDAYPNDVARGQAEQLLEAETFRFDMDDAIGGAGQQAIFQGVIAYLQDPGSLASILQSIDDAIGAAPADEQPTEPAGDGETPDGG